MNLTIKPLAPGLAADYFDFFENRAFTDDSPYRCYCQVYQMTKAQYQEAYDKAMAGDGADIGRLSREVAERQIAGGVLRGYLAYVDGVSIGWCNANDRANYPAEQQYDVPFFAPADRREMAVVCFEIAPEHRQKGVATALLQQVITDAKDAGYAAVVGFPILRDERYEWDCAGPVRLYEKTGFTKIGEKAGRLIVRKELN
ncbi:MAG: GNAT family N-acetyltransferase [Oscillospiraceae bacterium]|nr:GNAT family N-acetyltransferase [Oscillospiraceae bacterium]